jgi:hypothetical protein
MPEIFHRDTLDAVDPGGAVSVPLANAIRQLLNNRVPAVVALDVLGLILADTLTMCPPGSRATLTTNVLDAIEKHVLESLVKH